MLKLKKSTKDQIKSFLTINAFWIIFIYLWNFLQMDPEIEIPEELKDPFKERMDGLNLLLGGVLMGTIFSLLNMRINKKQEQLRKQSYGRIILFYSIVHLILTVICVFIIGILSQYIMIGEINKEDILEIRSFVRSANFFKILIYTYLISSGIILMQIFNQKFGPGVLIDLLLGKYRQPKEVKMIFLFMDLKSSTTYAEKLGHKKYSQLIQDCFTDLTLAVNEFNANIYQYIGDEVVLIWPYEEGVRNAKCVKVFYRFKEYLEKRSDHYLSSYGFVPQFKAGLNGGTLMAAEVGVIKRSIAYHGDVINTASRIQGLCNSFEKEFLASKLIISDLSVYNTFNYSYIDNLNLKGKKEKVSIYSINKTHS
ncbi:adenylate/guanylate cyclase domain-containing protein [Marinifilum caeruleilacunae]|uniref:Adenylate/guanylate cyclase domain-containing protein n=1 Tax=Marinifilum caeruleilacunae TaxID=2499076 RepID=A0ABX1WVQ8_9BACT|nr:adenylate/guanylate cyclase domain-containing protein [Marinifilum caeruleilacunae]NOU60208.1 adenylate/guanylate cyclase domain-containing protein [Marinifilum caeruleilacunae]